MEALIQQSVIASVIGGKEGAKQLEKLLAGLDDYGDH
jgi:hypothetical protein